MTDDPSNISEIVEIAHTKGIQLTDEQMARLTISQVQLRGEQQELTRKLREGLISDAKFVGLLTKAASNHMTRARSALGVLHYSQIFGSSSVDAEGILDEKLFIAERKKSSNLGRDGSSEF